MKITVLLFSIVLHGAAYLVLSANTQNTTQGTMVRQGKQVMTLASVKLVANPVPIEEIKPQIEITDKNTAAPTETPTVKTTNAIQTTSLATSSLTNSKALGKREKVLEKSAEPEALAVQAPEAKQKDVEEKQELISKTLQNNDEVAATQKTDVLQAAGKKSNKNNKVMEKPISIDSQAISVSGEQGDNAKHANIGSDGEKKDAWDSYKASVFAAINAQKVYPKQARIRRTEGIVEVEFTIDALGNVGSFTLVKKVNSKHLNRSTQRLFAQLSLPKPTSELHSYFPTTLKIPIKYSLN